MSKRRSQTPRASGTYNLKFQLEYKDQPVKGGAAFKTIAILPKDQARIATNTLPIAVLKQWGSARISLRITNISKNEWAKNTTTLRLSKNSADMHSDSWIDRFTITRPEESATRPGASATFIFPLQFSRLPRGRAYYSFELNINGETLKIEGGDGVMRID